jgi:hypothetical protein
VQRAQTSKGAIFIRSGEPAVTDNVDDKNSCELSGLGHSTPASTVP